MAPRQYDATVTFPPAPCTALPLHARWPVLISRLAEDRRLSWPAWLVGMSVTNVIFEPRLFAKKSAR